MWDMASKPAEGGKHELDKALGLLDQLNQCVSSMGMDMKSFMSKYGDEEAKEESQEDPAEEASESPAEEMAEDSDEKEPGEGNPAKIKMLIMAKKKKMME